MDMRNYYAEQTLKSIGRCPFCGVEMKADKCHKCGKYRRPARKNKKNVIPKSMVNGMKKKKSAFWALVKEEQFNVDVSMPMQYEDILTKVVNCES
jgi:methionyl-tRNA synthetase